MAHSAPALDRRDERPGRGSVVASDRLSTRESAGSAVYGVAVHEVEPGAARAARRTAATPARACTVFQPMCGSTGASSGSTAPRQHCRSPSVRTPCSTPASNSTCMPTQMPSTGAPAGQPLRGRSRGPPTAAQPGHARGERAHARHDQAVGALGRGRRRRVTVTSAPTRSRARWAERRLPEAVVEHDHASAEPCVLRGVAVRGRPWCSARRRPAGRAPPPSRSARATALNCASTMWCESRPLCTMTCRPMRACTASDSKTCRVKRRAYWLPISRRRRRPARGAPGRAVRTGRRPPAPAPRPCGMIASPKRRMPALSPSSLARARRRAAMAASSTQWCASMSQVALGPPASGRTGRACRQRVEHVVEEPHAGGHVGVPGTVEVELDQHLVSAVSAPPVRSDSRSAHSHARRAACSTVSRTGASASTCSAARRGIAVISAAVPTVTRSQPRDADVAHQHAALQQLRPDLPGVGRAAEQARSWRRSAPPSARADQLGDQPVPLRLDLVHGGEQLGRRAASARASRGLGERRQVVRQPDQVAPRPRPPARRRGSPAAGRPCANALLIVRVTTSLGERGQQR